MPRDDNPEIVASRTRRGRRRLRLALLLLGPLVLTVAAAYYYVTGGRYVSTDDAYVRYDKVLVSSDVSGRIVEVAVGENETVKQGQRLFRIDDEPYRIALARSEALLAAARAEVEALKASYKQKQAQLKAAQASAEFMAREYERQKLLASQNVASVSKVEDARRGDEVAREQVAAMQQDIAQVLANLGGGADLPIDHHPKVRQAIAARDQAVLDLRHTEIVASTNGVIASLDLAPGQYVTVGQPICSLVESGSLYIEANLKETDLTHVKPGEAATISIDAYPDHVWRATVASISPGTGSEFSVLPAQNATGNWVKVVQRVPLRLQLDPGESAEGLRAGMSVDVTVDTRHENPLPGPVAAALARMGGR